MVNKVVLYYRRVIADSAHLYS